MNTEMDGTTSVAQRVFDTYELCENILKNLQPIDLLRARGVCRTSSSLVQRSVTLREHLYLLSSQESDTIWHINYDWCVKCGGWDRRNVSATHSRANDQCLAEHLVCIYNPLILAKDEAYASRGLLGSLLLQSEFSVDSRPESFIEDNALFREMHLTQPPVTRVGVWMRTFSTRGVQGTDEKRVLRNVGGVRFGEVLDMIQTLTSQKKCRRASWITFPGVCAVTAEQKEFVERKGVVTRDSDPWPSATGQPGNITKAEDARSAGDRVFGTYELCENILKRLPPNDLLRMRRLCCTAKSLLEQSLGLKQNLFLVPTTEPGTIWHLDAVRHLRYGPRNRTIVINGQRATEDYPVSVYNPLIIALDEATGKLGLKGCRCEYLDCRRLYLDCNLESLAKDALCMNMQLAQPPVFRVELSPRDPEADDEERGYTVKLGNADGVRIGEVIKALCDKEHFGNERDGSWWLDTPEVCAVTTEQMRFVEHMRVVPERADPWLERMDKR
ncbi:hypothetical protein LTS10_006951 [Elasticomyces elasticus]|nr:hypothetical protein LTS10_006951 [Elasticomyces elasticus]